MAEHSNVSGRSLKAIAHPLRVRLLGLLREDGPSTATKLGERIGQSSGVTSYHLRQLAGAGFVADDAELGSGRERWWRAVSRRTILESSAAREAPADAEAYLRAVAAQYADRVDRWLYEVGDMPTAWDAAVGLFDFDFRLTAAEATALANDLRQVLGRYREDVLGVEAPAGAERIAVQLQLMPFIRPTPVSC